MKVSDCLKTVIIFVSLWLCSLVSDNSASAEDITGSIGVSAVTGSAITYYVGGNGASDTNDGISSMTPFATLDKAVSEISYDRGNIIVQSDLLVYRPVVIYGDVSIISDGNTHKISRDTKYYSYGQYGSNDIWSMFIICGKLTLGNKDNTDMTQSLVFQAYNDPYLYADGPLETIYIDTSGEANLYNGVTLDGNNRGAAIYNKGKFNMYGGIISNNVGPYAGGIYNCMNGSCTMSGGTILDNETKGSMIDGVIYGSGGIFNTGYSTFVMIGGSIYNNTGYSSSGIYNGTNCTFNMTGGTLGINYTAHYANGIFNDTGANFIIGQDANILPEDEIWLVEGSTITVNSKLKTPNLWVIIISAKFNTTTRTFNENYTPGTQIITEGAGYDLSTDEINSIFMIPTNDYNINGQGKIAKGIKSAWVSLPNGTEYTYTGSAITPLVKIVAGTKTLLQGTDYTVSYNGNSSVGLHSINITGIGSYDGNIITNYIIKPAVVTSIITTVADVTTSAENCYNINQLTNLIHTSSVEVKFDGGSGVSSVNWKLTEGTYNYQGGNYTFTGTLMDSNNILSGGLMLTTHIYVTPVLAKVNVFNDITVPIGTNKIATAIDLGESILPTSGSYNQSGSYESGYPNAGTVTYTIDWGNKTLNTTNNKVTTTFVGTVTYANYPIWLTIPENVIVSRTVGVTGKIIVNIICDIGGKTYDGKPVITGTPSNKQGYAGEYEILYVSNDGKGYSSKIAPKNAGDYKCIISVTDDLTSYTGSKEIYFSIFKKNITIIADNKTIILNDPLPFFTYHYEEGKGLITGETLIVEPTLSALSAETGKVSDYSIENEGADAGENYTILLVDGVLSVKAPTIYSITTSAGPNGKISPDGMQSVLHNTDKTFVFTPNANYAVSSVTIDGVNIGSVATYTFHNVTTNHSVSVIFVTAPAAPVIPPLSGGGGGAPSGGGGGAPVGGAVTPSVSPTPTVTPNKTDIKSTSGKISLIGSDGAASVSIKKDEQKGSLNITFELTEDEILTQKNQNGSQDQPQDITILINSEQLLEQIENENIKEINFTITIPKDLQNNKNVGDINSVLGEELLAAAKEDGKNITVSISNEEGKEQYAWTFTGSNLAKSNQDIEDVNLSLDVEAINNTEMKELLSASDSKGKDGSKQSKGLVINFSHHGDLPSQANVRIFVGNQEGIRAGDNVILYYYNSETNKLDSLPYSSGYTVDADGYVTVQILHCSNYVLLTESPDYSVVTAIIDQIIVSVTEKTLYLGGTTGDTTDYIITLPSTLEWVSAKNKASSSAVGAVNITFTSDNPKVAVVDNLGHITAKSIGTCTISTKVILYNGKTKIYKTNITVKEPYISISKSKKTMKVGDTFLFAVHIDGFKNENIKWSTSKKSIIEINSKTGKATAVSSGVDYIVAKVGNKKIKVKVVVSQK